jgi:hypothetical protein
MGLEFSFDDANLDQQVSRDQLEIDLYDELITISDAEPDEQVKMLATKPATVAGHQGNDKPESIRVTGSLGRERAMGEAPPMPSPAWPEQDSMPAAGAPPARPAKSAPLPSAYPAVADPGNMAVPTNPNGQKPVPVRPVSPNPMPAERRPAPVERPPVPAPMQVPTQHPLPSAEVQAPPRRVSQQLAAPPRAAAPPPVAPPRAAPVMPVPETRFVNKCPDCGQPAGDLDLICIECGGFIG